VTGRILPALLLVFCASGSPLWCADPAAAGDTAARNQSHALEGVLKIHPKYLYKYYITGFGDGQKCALFGEEELRSIKSGSFIRVEGRLGTRFHDGGTPANPSPFPNTCYIYMDVDSIKVLRESEE